MIHQRVKGRNISPLAGALLIAGLAVSIVLVSWIERAIAMTTGFQYGAFAVWLLVAAEALAVTRLGVMELRYSLGEGHFIVERVYGANARAVHDIPLDRILAVGEKDDIFRRFGNGQAYEKATLRKAPLREMAIAYRKEGADTPSLLLVQPDDDMLGALRRVAEDNQTETSRRTPVS